MAFSRSLMRAVRRHQAEGLISLRQRRVWHTTGISTFTSAGIDRVLWARNNANGIPMGAAGTLANGADAAMSRLKGIQNFNVALQQPRRVNIPGDDGVQAQFLFEADTLPSGDMVLGVFNAALVAAAQGSKTYTDGDFSGFVLQPGSPTYNQLTIMTISQAKSSDSGSGGEAGFLVMIFPKVQIVPLGATGLANAAGTNFTHALTITKSSKLPWGLAFSVANHGTTEAAGYGFFSENRVMLHTHVGDNTDDAMTLSETPAADNGNKVKDWQTNAPLTYGSSAGNFNNTGTAFAWVTAPGTGVVDVVRYEHV